MTATPANIPDQPNRVVPLESAPVIATFSDRKALTVALGTLLVLFLLLQNQYWVPGGDSEVYTGAARSLAQGKGYSFGGVPVSIVPPGWSIVLAGAMKISAQFLFLKLITMSFMVTSLAVMYCVCRRFAAPGPSAAAIMLTGIISHVYSLTFWLHSDAFFWALSSMALLLALQINEGRPLLWRMAAVVLLCGAAVTVRWAGLLSMLLVCAALLQGEFWPRLHPLWITAGLCTACALGTFFAVRAAIHVLPDQQKTINETLGTGEGVEGSSGAEPGNVAMQYSLFNPAGGGLGYLARIAGWGNWFSYLIWQPFRLRGFLNVPGLIAGWTVLLPLLLLALRAMRTRQWLWLALVLYSLGLAINWPHPVARYLVPVTPLILLGVFVGFPQLFRRNYLSWIIGLYGITTIIFWDSSGTARQLLVRPLVVVAAGAVLFFFFNRLRRMVDQAALEKISGRLIGTFVASLVLCNGLLWAVDVYVAHSRQFYAAYEAGLNQGLVDAAYWLNEHAGGDDHIAVSRRYVNMGRPKIDSVLGLRITAMLTGRVVVPVRDPYVKPRREDGVIVYSGDPRKNQNFLAWARQVGVKYALYQPEVSPWRVFHFRMGWLQEWMTKEPVVDTGAGWRLYEIPVDGDEAKRISIPEIENWPTRVPGM